MIIQEKIKAISLAADPLVAGRMFHSEAPQSPPAITLPYAVFYMDEEPLRHQNSGLSRTRVWTAYLYAHDKSPLLANRAAQSLKTTYCKYKETSDGAADSDIQAITLDTGIVDLERDAQKKLCCCSIVLKVTEQIGA